MAASPVAKSGRVTSTKVLEELAAITGALVTSVSQRT